MQSKVQLTQAGADALKLELKQLQEKRPSVVERLSNARSMGDLSENNDYHNAKDELEFLDGRISELEEVLSTAQVVQGKNGKSKHVELGTKVKVKVGKSEHVFSIVGDWEADPKEKKISHTSPLGQALVGKKPGEKALVSAPAGKVEYTILEVA